jgi:hypothetical protein
MKKIEYEALGWTKKGIVYRKGNIKVRHAAKLNEANGKRTDYIKVEIDGKLIDNNYKTLNEALQKL